MTHLDYIALGFVSNDHLAVLPYIPMDTKVKMLSHAIIGGGPTREEVVEFLSANR